MDKDTHLTSSQLTLLLVGSMIGVGVLTLPLDVVKVAKQDGWISAALGMVYPLYFVLLAQYMHKKFPKENVLMLSHKCFGKFLGNILNFVFLSFFLVATTEVASGINNVLSIYMVPFLTKYKILITLFLPPAFIAHKGIKTLVRMNVVVFYSTFVAFLIPIAALKEGSLLNITPVFGSGVINIIKSTKDTTLAYCGIEIILLIYPFFQDNKKLKKCGVTSAIITGVTYVWFTFSSIFYLGINIIPKFLWPVVTVTEAITIPIINSFRYIFMSLWTILMFRVLSIHYFGFTFGLSQLTKVANRKSLVILTYPLFFYISTKYGNPTMRRAIVGKIVPIYGMYNLIYATVIALLISIKTREKCEEKPQE